MSGTQRIRNGIAALERIAEGRVYAPERIYGLCSAIRYATNYHTQFIKDFDEICKEWPGRSDNEGHPVPCPDGGNPVVAYRTLDMYEGAYGELRKDLAAYAAKKLTKRLRRIT